MARRHDHRLDRADLGNARQRPDAVGAQIGFGEHAEHARRLRCAAAVSIRSITAWACGERSTYACSFPGQSEVLDIPPAPGQKPEILEPAHRAPAIIVGCHRVPSASGRPIAQNGAFATRPPIAGKFTGQAEIMAHDVELTVRTGGKPCRSPTTSVRTGRSLLRHAPLLAAALAVIAVVLLGSAPIGWRAGWWHYRFALLSLMPWAAYFGVAALVVAVLALSSAARGSSGGGSRSRSPPLRRAGWSPMCPGIMTQCASTVPPINDITTDTANPPAFAAVVPRARPRQANPVAYRGAKFADQQKQAYPDIAPLTLDAAAKGCVRSRARRLRNGWAGRSWPPTPRRAGSRRANGAAGSASPTTSSSASLRRARGAGSTCVPRRVSGAAISASTPRACAPIWQRCATTPAS